MTVNWLDYAYGRPDPASMRLGGILGVSRYLWQGGKGVSVEEIAALHAHGLMVLANFEALAGMVLESAAAGADHAKTAVELAGAAGFPAGKPIVYSADADLNLTGPQSVTLGNTFDAYNSHRGPYGVGVYGEADVLDWLFKRGLATFGWQTVAWSQGRISAHAALYQASVNNVWRGASVDFGQVLDLKQVRNAAWGPAAETPSGGGSPIPSGPIPAPAKERDDMSFEIVHNVQSGAVRAIGPNMWVALEGKTRAETLANIAHARIQPLCANNGIVRDVSDNDMHWLKRFYTTGTVAA